MQSRGQLDYEDYAKPDLKKYADLNVIVLYLFEKSDYKKHPSFEKSEKKFVNDREKYYENIYSKKFEGVGKWQQYKRQDKLSIEHNINAIYEIVDNTGFY